MDDNNLLQLKQVFEFLDNPKTKNDALNTILSISEAESFRFLLLKTEICKIMIRQLEADKENNSLILQIIINLSADDAFKRKFVDLNAIYRIITLFFQKIDNFKGSQDNDSKNFEVKMSKIYL